MLGAGQVMKKAEELGLKSYIEENGMPAQSRDMLKRKKADGLSWILTQPVIDEKEVRSPLLFPQRTIGPQPFKQVKTPGAPH